MGARQYCFIHAVEACGNAILFSDSGINAEVPRQFRLAGNAIARLPARHMLAVEGPVETAIEPAWR